MKIVKGLMLMALGAGTVLLYQRYGDQMMSMVDDMVYKTKCKCEELED